MISATLPLMDEVPDRPEQFDVEPSPLSPTSQPPSAGAEDCGTDEDDTFLEGYLPL